MQKCIRSLALVHVRKICVLRGKKIWLFCQSSVIFLFQSINLESSLPSTVKILSLDSKSKCLMLTSMQYPAAVLAAPELDGAFIFVKVLVDDLTCGGYDLTLSGKGDN